MRWARMVSADSTPCHSGKVGEATAMYRTGWSAGFTLRNAGGLGMPGGSNGVAWVMAVWTSTAAPSKFRRRSKVRVIDETPSALLEIIESSPGIVENWRSSGVATAEAIVSGLAPGSAAL